MSGIDPKQLTRANRTRYAHTVALGNVTTLVDKSASASTAILFFTGQHKAKITAINLFVIETFQTADADIDIGYLFSNGVVTADPDAYTPNGIGLLNANQAFNALGAPITPPSAVGGLTAGVSVRKKLDIVVPPRTVVQIAFNQTTGAGTYYPVVEWEPVQEIPAEN